MLLVRRSDPSTPSLIITNLAQLQSRLEALFKLLGVQPVFTTFDEKQAHSSIPLFPDDRMSRHISECVCIGRRMGVACGVADRPCFKIPTRHCMAAEHCTPSLSAVPPCRGISQPVNAQCMEFRQADLVIGPHGSALTNMLCAREDTAVIELLHSAPVNLEFLHLAWALNLRYQGMHVPLSVQLGSTPVLQELDINISHVEGLVTSFHVRNVLRAT